MERIDVTFMPEHTRISVDEGKTIMQAAAQAGVELEGPCGGKGTCGKCRVRVVGTKDFVLACQIPVNQEITVEIPQAEVSLHRKSEISGTELSTKPDPGVRKVVVVSALPSLENQASDTQRLLVALSEKGLKVELEALRALPQAIRSEQGVVTAVLVSDRVIMVEPGDTTETLYGLAVDVGTTTVVGMLVDLTNGDTVATASATNIQNIFGADVIARIEHASQNPQGLKQLQQRVVHVINRLILNLVQAVPIEPEQIFQASVVGNTTMSHLFLGVDPANLAPSPFIPVFSRTMVVDANALGLQLSPHAPVRLMPNIAGYVGGDTVGVILSTGIYKGKGVRLAVDIGTNGEMVLSVNGRLLSCSTAAGPAFEGAQIRFGMRAAKGAIEGVSIAEDVELKVIGDSQAVGICGSGLIDAVAELVRTGIIEGGGRIISREEADHLPDVLRNRLGHDDSGNYVVLASGDGADVKDVVLTQKDVRELQLAKAAVRAGIDIMLEQVGLSDADIDEVLLAGAFGSNINKESALRIGLLPPIPLEKIRAVGNAAGAGAKFALLSEKQLELAALLARQTDHMELSGRSDFQDKFVDALGFGEEL